VLGVAENHNCIEVLLEMEVLLSTCAKALRRKGHWLTMNLITMIEVIKAQLPK
jgi:hypothetical protein